MSDPIDWLHSSRCVCKVDLYSPTEWKEQERKVIYFVDVATLNVEDKGSKVPTASDQASFFASSEWWQKLEAAEALLILRESPQALSDSISQLQP